MSESKSTTELSNEFYREIQKLEIRLNDYLADEELFIKTLRNCIAQFKTLHTSIEKQCLTSNPLDAEQFQQQTFNATTLFGEVMINQGKAEHERSHLLESYGALLLSLKNLETNLHHLKK